MDPEEEKKKAEALRKAEAKRQAAKPKKKKKPDPNRPASTDVADLEPYSPEDEDKFDEDARKSHAKGMKQDIHGRIINISVVGGQAKITIAAHIGKMTGVEGYIKRGSGMLAKFRIARQDDRTSIAFVDLTPDQIHEHLDVVINPAAMPASSQRRHDITTRVIGVSIEGGKTKIMIGVGSSHGARDGMKGQLLSSSGKPHLSFLVKHAKSTYSEAFVDTNIDDVIQHSSILLNPS